MWCWDRQLALTINCVRRSCEDMRTFNRTRWTLCGSLKTFHNEIKPITINRRIISDLVHYLLSCGSTFIKMVELVQPRCSSEISSCSFTCPFILRKTVQQFLRGAILWTWLFLKPWCLRLRQQQILTFCDAHHSCSTNALLSVEESVFIIQLF